MSPSHESFSRQETLVRINKARLYGILDTGYSEPAHWPEIAAELISGGVGMLQIRAKDATRKEIIRWTPRVLKICRARHIPLVLNDLPELAKCLHLDGCHLGQNDMPLEKASEILDKCQILGKSTHSLKQALAAEKEGADYIGFGPIYSTPTKPDYPPIGENDIRSMYASVRIPAFCIGGIKSKHLNRLVDLGAQRVVIVSGLLTAEDPREYAQNASRILQCAATEKSA